MASILAWRRIPRSGGFAARYITGVVGLIAALCACADERPEPSLLSVEPKLVSNQTSTIVRVLGKRLVSAPKVSLGSTQAPELQHDYRIQVGEVFEPDTVDRISDEQLQFTLPAGIAPATYDVRVTPPFAATMTLTDALTVSDRPLSALRDASVPLLALSLETQADGQGEIIQEQTLTVGQTLELFAVFRDAAGAPTGAAGPVHFSMQPVLGRLSEQDAPQTVFSALLPGDLSLLAESDLATSARVSLHIVPDPQTPVTDYSLSLEDAPGGTGAPLSSGRSYTAGDVLECFAVARDSADNFVLDVPVSWTVSGAQSAPEDSSSLSLVLSAAGAVSVVAMHPTLGDATLTVDVRAGPAARLALSPDSATLTAGDAPVTWTVVAEDAFSNPTDDIGELTFTLADGGFGDFDPSGPTLTPRLAGAGHVSVRSSYGVSATSGLIQVLPGRVTQLSLSPDTLQLSTDDAPVQFEVTGQDAYGNATATLGDLTWAVVSGGIGTLSPLGVLDPVRAGTGTVQVTSSLGPSAQSATIEISAGRAQTLTLQPQSWLGIVGGAAQSFSATGVDADGNATSDLGILTFATQGPIGTIDAQTGLFTPTTQGQGAVTVSSSYGLQATSPEVVVTTAQATLTLAGMRVPSSMFLGATAAVEVDVTNTDVADAIITGLGLSFADSSARDISAQYTVVAANTNSDRVAPGATQTLVYYVSVSGAGDYLGQASVSARGEAFLYGRAPIALSRAATTTVRYPTWGTALTIDAPAPPADGVCSGGRVKFGATASYPFSYTWSFPDGTLAPGSLATDRTPSVDYTRVGPRRYAVSVEYTWLLVRYVTLLPGPPLYVGTAEAALPDTYPTGHVVFASPTPGQSVALTSLPRSDLVTLDPALPVRQCDGSPVDPSGHNLLTVFSDRKLIDPTADVDPVAPGIQLPLTAAGVLGSLPLIAPTSGVEGPSTLYLEYFAPSLGVVTAAGDVTFTLTGDTQPPSVWWSSPASDCGLLCLNAGEAFRFQLSEPLSNASLDQPKVELLSGPSCQSPPNLDLTSTSQILYEPSANLLSVVPPAQSGMYTVRVSLPSTLTDAATNPNPLPAYSVCAIFGALGAPKTASQPQLAARVSSPFSPDGDQTDESARWTVLVDAATSLVRVRITRSDKLVRTLYAPVTQAGELTVSWDGSDATGRVVENGAYGYAIEALDRAGQPSAALRGYVEVSSAVRMVSVRRRL